MVDSDDFQLNYYVNTIKIPLLGDLNVDDLVYLLCILLSIPIGLLFKKTQFSPVTRALLSGIIGFTTTLFICKIHAYHSIVVVLVNSLLLSILSPRLVHYFSFIWCFGYILFFRSTTYFGFEKPIQFSNAIQLILTLKSVGAAFEIHDTYERKNSLFKLNHKLKNLNETVAQESIQKDQEKVEKLKLEMEFYSLDPKPSFFHLCLYSYCHIGLLTGPYFKYRTYHDWLHTKYNNKISSLSFIIKRAKTVPIILLTYVIVSRFASFKDSRTDEFYERPLWYRLVYMTLVFTLFKLRFYIGWILAEFSCMTAGFGVYPSVSKPRPGGGPTDLVELKKFTNNETNDNLFNYNAIHNIDEYGVETALTVKSVLHTWNETVQYWMAAFVYKRVFFRPIGQAWTMFVSAYWHGLHPGYYMSMLTVTPGIWAETYMDKGFKKRFMSPKYYFLFDFWTWFCRSRLFDYMSLGFILLDYESVIRFWSSVYYIGHIYCLVFTILGFLLCQLPKAKTDKNKEL